MANSRLEKIGTIYSRITGLLRSGAVKDQDKPLWYNIYRAFPPKYPPKFDRTVPKMEVREIFYAEDKLRARISKSHPNLLSTVNLKDSQHKTNMQKLILLYNEAIKDGVSEDEAILRSIDKVSSEHRVSRTGQTKRDVEKPPSLADSFKEAQSQSVDLKDIFKS